MMCDYLFRYDNGEFKESSPPEGFEVDAEIELPSIEDIRSRWGVLKQSEEGLREVERWMVDAARYGLIGVDKFNEMDKAVGAARLILIAPQQ